MQDSPTYVVVGGGGFASVACAKLLAEEARVRVTLFDQNGYHPDAPTPRGRRTRAAGHARHVAGDRWARAQHRNVLMLLVGATATLAIQRWRSDPNAIDLESSAHPRRAA